MVLTVPDRLARIGDVFLMLDETQPTLDRTTDMRSFTITIDEVARWAGLSAEAVEDEIRRYIDQGKMEVYDDRIVIKNITELSRFVNARRSKETD